MADQSLPASDPINTFNMEGVGGTKRVPQDDTTTCVIMRRDRIRLGDVDRRKSLTENFTTVMNVFEKSLMTPAQIDAANPSEVFEAEHVIELVLGVLHDGVVSCDTCKFIGDVYDKNPCDGCFDFSEWEKMQDVNK